MFQLKNYQNNTLEVLANYLDEARISGARDAFYKIKGNSNIPYHAIHGLEDIPYVCLRLPTGGGKTFLSVHSIKLAAQHYVDKDFPMVLWLTPTSAIKEQTIETLKNPTHPNREVLDAAFNGNVAIFDIDDFTNIRPSDIANKTCVFVSTVQSFNVKNTDIRNIYADNENLEPHFVSISAQFQESLEKVEAGKADAGRVKNSFANLLHIHEPIIIVDEAHKAVTELNREIMNRLNPSCILEFTATPNEKESNVLYRVSAVELKAEEMIKLPIMLTETQTWQQSLTEACLMQNKLAQTAKLEKEYIRPIVLIQAENKGQETTEDKVKQYLIENEHVTAERIAIATGDEKGLDGINILDPKCPIDFVITKQALREGWDCPFAYIFCSVAQTRSLTAVEQFLGRILRMPYAKKRSQADLNKAYAYVSSACWTNSVAKLKDSLVEMGFDEQESTEFLRPEPKKLDLQTTFKATKLDTSTLTEEDKKELSIETYMDGSVTMQIKQDISPILRDKVAKLLPKQEQIAFFTTCGFMEKKELSFSEKGAKFSVPQLCLFTEDSWNVIQDREFYLPNGWKLLDFPAELTPADFSISHSGKVFEIDIDGKRVTERIASSLFLRNVEDAEAAWTNLEFSRWLDREIPQIDIPQPVLLEFLRRIVDYLTVQRQMNINALVRTKFLLAKAIDQKIDSYRKQAYKKGYQEQLFDLGTVETKMEYSFEFGPNYPANLKYEGSIRFNKHYYPFVGQMNDEEAQCAQLLDSLPQVKYWVRNIERYPAHSFSLPTSTDRFYPDFVALLNDGRLLAVEYKGEHLVSADDAKEKENIGNLWAEKSNNKCLFTMLTKENYRALLQDIVKA